MQDKHRVAVIELPDELESFLSYVKESSLAIEDFELIALDHVLQAELRKRKIPFSNSLDYFDSKSQAQIVLKYSEISQYIENRLTITDEFGVEKAYKREILHYLEFIFNYVSKILLIYDNIHLSHPDLELYVCGQTVLTDSPTVSSDRLLAEIADEFARAKGITLVKWPSLAQDHTIEPHQRSSEILEVKTSRIYTAFVKLFIFYAKILRKKIILLPTKHYGFQPLIDEIKKRYKGVVFLTPYSDPKDTHRKFVVLLYGFLFKHFRIDLDFLPPVGSDRTVDIRGLDLTIKLEEVMEDHIFKLCGVALRKLISAKVTTGLYSHIRSLEVSSGKLDRLMDDLDVRLIMSPFGRDIWALMPEIGKKRGIPSLFVSHGTHPAPTNKLHDLAIHNLCQGFMLGEYSHIALSTPVQEAHLRYYKREYPSIRNQEIKTGPLIFATLADNIAVAGRKKLGIDSDEFVLLHATTIKWKGNERFHFLETTDEYISALSDIVGIVNDLINFRLIIRLHPGLGLTEAHLRSFLPPSEKVIISADGSFTDVLSAADALISYSSTCIDEALINKIPVILYDKWNRYNHFNAGIFENSESEDIFPVCYINDPRKLKSGIEQIEHCVRSGSAEKMDISRYSYDQELSDNFFNFIEALIKGERK